MEALSTEPALSSPEPDLPSTSTPPPADISSEGCIRPLAGQPVFLGGSLVRAGVVLLFLSIIFGTLAIDLLHWDSPDARRAWKQLEGVGWKEIASGEGTKLAEAAVQEASEVRAEVSPLWTRFLLRLLDHLPSKVVVGKDEWLFLSSRLITFEKAEAGAVRDIAAGAQMIACLDRRVAQRGCALTLVFVPRKGLVAHEFLGDRVLQGPTFHGIATTAFEEAGIEAPDLLAPLSQDPARYWQAQDSHWSHEGTWRACGVVAERAGLLLPSDARPTRPVWTLPQPQGADLRTAVGLERRRETVTTSPRHQAPQLRTEAPDGRPFSTRFWRGHANATHVLAGTSYSFSFPVAASLHHFTGLDIHDRSRGVHGPIFSITPVLSSAPMLEGKLRRLFWEVPSFYLFCPVAPDQQVHSLPRALARLEPKRSTLLQELDFGAADGIAKTVLDVGLERSAQPQWLVLRSPPGNLTSSGDGVVFFRLFRQTTGPSLSIRTHVNGIRRPLTMSWPADRESITVPAFNLSPGEDHRVVILGPPARQGLVTRVQIHVEGELSPERFRPPSEVVSEAGRSTVRFAFEPPVPWDKTTPLCLISTSKASGGHLPLLREVRVQLADDSWHTILGTDPRPTPLPRLTVLTARKHHGRVVTAVEVRTEGPVPPLHDLRLAFPPAR